MQKGRIIMKRSKVLLMLILTSIVVGLAPLAGFSAATCVDCHRNTTPSIVTDWQISKHGQTGIDCSTCHGDQHTSAADVAKAQIPTPDTCATCHDEKVKQYRAGKHAFAWTAMKAMPTMHFQPSIMAEGMKGCGGMSQDRSQNRGGDKGSEKNQPWIWHCIMRRLPHPPYILG